jgi:hypothetical protein
MAGIPDGLLARIFQELLPPSVMHGHGQLVSLSLGNRVRPSAQVSPAPLWFSGRLGVAPPGFNGIASPEIPLRQTPRRPTVPAACAAPAMSSTRGNCRAACPIKPGCQIKNLRQGIAGGFRRLTV